MSEIFVLKIVKIWQLVFKLQSKKSGMLFGTVYIAIFVPKFVNEYIHLFANAADKQQQKQ